MQTRPLHIRLLAGCPSVYVICVLTLSTLTAHPALLQWPAACRSARPRSPKQSLAVMLVFALDARSVVPFQFVCGRHSEDDRLSHIMDLLDLRAAA